MPCLDEQLRQRELTSAYNRKFSRQACQNETWWFNGATIKQDRWAAPAQQVDFVASYNGVTIVLYSGGGCFVYVRGNQDAVCCLNSPGEFIEEVFLNSQCQLVLTMSTFPPNTGRQRFHVYLISDLERGNSSRRREYFGSENFGRNEIYEKFDLHLDTASAVALTFNYKTQQRKIWDVQNGALLSTLEEYKENARPMYHFLPGVLVEQLSHAKRCDVTEVYGYLELQLEQSKIAELQPFDWVLPLRFFDEQNGQLLGTALVPIEKIEKNFENSRVLCMPVLDGTKIVVVHNALYRPFVFDTVLGTVTYFHDSFSMTTNRFVRCVYSSDMRDDGLILFLFETFVQGWNLDGQLVSEITWSSYYAPLKILESMAYITSKGRELLIFGNKAGIVDMFDVRNEVRICRIPPTYDEDGCSFLVIYIFFDEGADELVLGKDDGSVEVWKFR